MEVAIGEDSMKTIGITVAWLIEDVDCLEYTIFVSKFSLEDVRDFGLRLGSESHSGSAILLGCWSIDEVSVGEFSLERGIGQDVAGGCLAYFCESEDCDGLIEEGEEGDVSGLYGFEEVFRLLLGGFDDFLHLFVWA